MRDRLIAIRAQLDELIAEFPEQQADVIPPSLPPALPASGLQNPDAFFDYIRGAAGELFPKMTLRQVHGVEFILNACAGQMPTSWTACALGTTYWETDRTMEPVREAFRLSEDWRKRNLRYFPWYGRGYVQLTWERNYVLADEKLELGGSLVANPDRAMEPEIAAQVLVRGMKEGWFTGKALNDYIPAQPDLKHFVASRRIINGTDRAETIAGICMEFYKGLVAGDWR